MPTPDPIAAPNPTTAARGPAPLVQPDGGVPQGFEALLTALLPVASSVADTPPQAAPDIRTDEATKAPKPSSGKMDIGRTSKIRSLLPSQTPVTEPKPPALDTPLPVILPIPPMMPAVQSWLADASPPGIPAEAAPLVISQTAPPHVSGPSEAAKRRDLPTPDRAPLQVDFAPVVSLPTSAPVLTPAPAKPASPNTAAPPVEQLAPVLLSVAHTPPGTTHLTLQLRPDALGDLHIAIDRAPGAPTQIRIEATRPETLALLQRDTTQLLHALDRAGVARDSMVVTFHAAPAVAPIPSTQDSGQTSTQFMGTGQQQQGFGEGRARQGTRPFTEAAMATDVPPPNDRSARSGINITA